MNFCFCFRCRPPLTSSTSTSASPRPRLALFFFPEKQQQVTASTASLPTDHLVRGDRDREKGKNREEDGKVVREKKEGERGEEQRLSCSTSTLSKKHQPSQSPPPPPPQPPSPPKTSSLPCSARGSSRTCSALSPTSGTRSGRLRSWEKTSAGTQGKFFFFIFFIFF